MGMVVTMDEAKALADRWVEMVKAARNVPKLPAPKQLAYTAANDMLLEMLAEPHRFQEPNLVADAFHEVAMKHGPMAAISAARLLQNCGAALLSGVNHPPIKIAFAISPPGPLIKKTWGAMAAQRPPPRPIATRDPITGKWSD